jgi:broad specificity phosphatase PhoE
MSSFTVVRHAQARPFEKNPDSLSELGQKQSRLLGEFWKSISAEFDEVWCGSLNRHCQTAEIALKALGWWGTPQMAGEFNEYDAEGMLRGYPPPSSFPDNRAFQKVFEVAMERWIAGEGSGEGYAAFRERVLRGLRTIQGGGSNRRVLLFTSGGPIGVLVQTALGAPDRSFADVNWRVRNCSITEFVFSAERLSLDSFNNISHFDAAFRTFR